MTDEQKERALRAAPAVEAQARASESVTDAVRELAYEIACLRVLLEDAIAADAGGT